MAVTRPLTNSELSTFRRCPRKWWLSYERGLKRKQWDRELDVKGALAVGSAFHAGLQSHYEGKTDAQAIEAGSLDGNNLTGIMVEGYLQWLEEEGADQELQVVEVEVTREAVSPTGRRLWAKADVRARRHNTWIVMDHKTCGGVDDYDATGVMQTQPLHYLLVERLSGAAAVEWTGQFYYNLARKVKRTVKAIPPFYKRLPIYHTDVALNAYAKRIEVQAAFMDGMSRAIELADPKDRAAVAYANPTANCTWDCPFFAVCPMLDRNPEGAELVLESSYEKGDPLAHHHPGTDA